ncbi:MAG TPA: family 20 glycosylhydrolase, partial [Puia sp.]
MNGLAQETPGTFSLIPQPVKCQAGHGQFVIGPETAIVLPGTGLFRQEAGLLNEMIKKETGYALPLHPQSMDRIRFVSDSSIVSPEGYRLMISEKEVVLSASQPAGIFMGIQTIRQLLPASIDGRGILPALSIEDEPAYSWRGMHLDVARHFFSIAYLRKFIDVMALYKMNKLHLHLTDDQGWRIEIKKYPKLTEEGAWRVFNNQDSACMNRAIEDPDFAIDPSHIIHRDGKTLYGGYYTQEEMKGLVAYAAERHITIIPEIDMPGHMMAAINAYPFLTCNGDNKWGALFTTPICPCNEASFEFAENVFSEIMAIFPSEYIHIGGDEVDRSDWGKSEACKELMKKEGITDLPALQSYFIRRMEKFFIAKGRRLIGWDEILEGGISPTAIVMYWRSWVPTAPAKAIRNGNAVIMTPGSPLYFDRPPDARSLYEVYHFDPIPAGLSGAEARSIIGAQANIWSENIPSENRADYMYMPRMTALAERLWTNRVSDYDSYLQRLKGQYRRLDSLKVHYRLPDLEGLISQNVFVDRDTLRIKKPLPFMEIRYTTDGTVPLRHSKLLSGPLVISRSGLVRIEAFAPWGLKGDVYDLHF